MSIEELTIMYATARKPKVSKIEIRNLPSGNYKLDSFFDDNGRTVGDKLFDSAYKMTKDFYYLLVFDVSGVEDQDEAFNIGERFLSFASLVLPNREGLVSAYHDRHYKMALLSDESIRTKLISTYFNLKFVDCKQLQDRILVDVKNIPLGMGSEKDRRSYQLF